MKRAIKNTYTQENETSLRNKVHEYHISKLKV
jgi:hypothetical protein